MAAKDASCSLAENDLIAYCRVGKGKAVLIADTDRIDDRLWTSDALPVLSHLIAGEEQHRRPSGAWLISQATLVSAMRWALGLIALLAVALDRFGVAPMSLQSPDAHIDRDSKPPAPDST